LKNQLRRAVVNIPSNIAEGDELGSNKKSIKNFFNAKGSAAVVLTQAIIAIWIKIYLIKLNQHAGQFPAC
jgi:four helix bundle protein